ncbi:MAG: hypothetical protein WA952_19085, partial [Lewinella sp.]
IEEERQETSAIISKYAHELSNLQQDAGLVDLQDQMINVNHMRGHIHDRDHYMNKRISDFLNSEGMIKYRKAVKNLRAGSLVERVDFALEELTDDDQPRSVLYRPVHLEGKLTFISFETINRNE